MLSTMFKKDWFFCFSKKSLEWNLTYCQVKLPVIPSRRRSRNERCRLGPEPIGGKLVGLVRDKLLSKDSVVGLPDATGGLFDRCDSVVSSSIGAAAPWMPMPIGGGVWPLDRLWLWWVISLNDRCFGEQSRDILRDWKSIGFLGRWNFRSSGIQETAKSVQTLISNWWETASDWILIDEHEDRNCSWVLFFNFLFLN